MSKDILIGAHVSVAGGFDKAIDNGESIGATCIQIFTKSNRQWRAKPIETEAAETYKKRFQESSIKYVVTHASYLINLGSKNKETADKSEEALAIELDRCKALGIPHLILHPGTQGAEEKQTSLEGIAKRINRVFDKTEKTTLLLETMAGQGTTLGSSFEEIAAIIKNIDDTSRIGVCLDTCHIFASGYKFQTKEEYNEMWKQFDSVIGRKYLKVIHMNDSKKDLGSRVDRHEHIGQGKIGQEAFGHIMNDPRLVKIPKILETPKDDGDEDDIRNIQLLISLINNKK